MTDTNCSLDGRKRYENDKFAVRAISVHNFKRFNWGCI